MTTGDGVDSDLVIPDSFGQCLSYEQQIAYILKLIEDIDTGVIVPEITADATVDQSTGTPSVTVVKTGEDEAPVFTFNFHNIKGERGERGEKGDTGETGATGHPGNDGADGISPTVTTAQIANGYRITITDADGSHVFDIYNGNDGETGPAGYSPTVTVQTITGGHSITITDEDGDHTFNVLDGTDGSDGSDGVSPVITSTPITGGHRITIVDAQGTTDVDVMDGVNGQDGATGATGNGIASTVLNQDYTLTITYTDGTTYTTPSIRGAQGAAGQNGTDGVSPTVTVTDHTNYHHIEITSAGGTEQFDVYDGTDGTDGTDGISPTVTVRSITGGHQIEIVSAGGTEQFDVYDGTDGSDGSDGISPTVSTTAITGGTRVTITDAQGSNSFDVMNGTGEQGPAGPGIAAGGTYGQFLMKSGSADYATSWQTVNLTKSTIFKTIAGVTVPTYETDTGGNITGAYVTLNQIDGGYDPYDPKIPSNSTLIFANGRAMRILYVGTNYRPYRIYLDYSAGWFTYLPKGGSAGQILAKSTANDGEVEWVSAPSVPIIGTITGADNAEIDITSGGAVFNNQFTSLTPNARLGKITPISAYTFTRIKLLCEVITKDGKPFVIIKPYGSFGSGVNEDNRISYAFYDATDGSTTFQQYAGYNVGLEFNDSDFTWSNELSSIHTALLNDERIPAVYIANPQPTMHFGNYSVDQVYLTSISGNLRYVSGKIRLTSKVTGDVTGTILKATAGTISMYDSFPG